MVRGTATFSQRSSHPSTEMDRAAGRNWTRGPSVSGPQDVIRSSGHGASPPLYVIVVTSFVFPTR